MDDLTKKLDKNKSYYRRYVTIDFIMLAVIIILMFIFNIIGVIIALGIAYFYPRMTSKVCVSSIDDKTKRFWISKTTWDEYRSNHDFNVFNEYRAKQRSRINTPSAEETTDVADELLKYKQLLDTDAITQEEFDKKKSQLFEVL